jgi:hypothetical protein
MRTRLLHIFLTAAVIAGISVSCGKDEAEIIPRSKMARIYAEMLVLDQWIVSTPGARMMADTSLVYEPVFEKYGFTSDDYRLSMDEYMNDPERYARILRSTSEILEKRIKDLEALQRLEQLRAALPKIKADFKAEDFFPYLYDEPYVHYYDSLSVEPDSVLWIYRLKNNVTADTIYDRIRMIILDSLAVSDTLALKDSLAVAEETVLSDTLALADSLLKQEKADDRHSLVMVSEGPVVKTHKGLIQNLIMDKSEIVRK